MQIPTRRQIEQLITEVDGPYVSIYMPTHRRGAETLQEPIRLKNLIREAELQLQSIGYTRSSVENIVHPLVELIEDFEFWQRQMDGLAIFRNERLFEVFQLDLEVPELSIVAARPHLKPMLALIGAEVRYFVLALSQNQARVFEGTRELLKEIDVEGMPGSLQETWQTQVEKSVLQAHTASASGTANHSAIFHGHGLGEEVTRERIHIYFRKIDQAIRNVLPASMTPLILATVDYLAPIYRKANSHPGLRSKSVSGNPSTLTCAELHALSLPIALEYFKASLHSATDRYLGLWHTQQASNELAEVLPAAICGRVDTLFTPVGTQIWGNYNAMSGAVQVSGDHDSGNQDLLNLAAIHTYLNGGTVYAVLPEEVPGGKAVAAVYRY